MENTASEPHLSVREALTSDDGRTVELRGWVARKNAVGGITFAMIRDGTGYMQVSAKEGVAPPEAVAAIRASTKESAVRVVGSVR